MTEPSFVERMAAQAGVTVGPRLKGGEFGAFLAITQGGVEVVLKALPFAGFGPGWERGAALAERLRATGYPAPRYLGTGWSEDGCWSVQERLPGEVPATLTPALASQLVALARRHRDAADGAGDLRGHVLRHLDTAVQTLRTAPAAARLADELAAVVERSADLPVRTADVTHYDFHTQNLLAAGDDVTGVFDWEGARPGDWRCDLANLVVTSTDQGSIDALAAEPPEIAAFFVTWHCARYLAFDVTNHPPGTIDLMAPHTEARLAHWWRATA